jgi:hypothetical protein
MFNSSPLSGIYDTVKRAVNNPDAVKRRLRIAAVRPFTRTDHERISYLEQDWDVLTILDACRYDLFADLNPFDVPVTKVHSNGTHTTEFLEQNFGSDPHPDIVYVTASPQVARSEAQFAHAEHVWRTHWDEDHRTVLPEDMTDVALSVAKEYPDKRIIVHYMQPHYPFIGEKGEGLLNYSSYRSDEHDHRIWEHLAASRVDPGVVRAAYQENLELALPSVERLVSNITGKVVVTSDHGNVFGKQVCPFPIKIYGHPPNIPDPDLTAVPWVELPFDNRRKHERAEIQSSTTEVTENVQDRLADLGYT